MDREIEADFIKRFCRKEVRERLIYELSSEKKRKHALSRFSHRYEDLFILRRMIEIPKPNSDVQRIYEILLNHKAYNVSYCISWNVEIDGKKLPLLEALQAAVGFGQPSILVFGERLSYFEAEQEAGPPRRFLLDVD